MQPASLDLTLERGDDARVTFRFLDAEAAPIVLAADEVTLELTWPGGALTLEDGAGLTTNGAAGEVTWAVTPAQLAAAPPGRITALRLVRTTVSAGRRSYAVGLLTLTDGPAPGDQTFDLTVQALTVTIAVSASGPTGGGGTIGDIPGLQAALDAKATEADLAAEEAARAAADTALAAQIGGRQAASGVLTFLATASAATAAGVKTLLSLVKADVGLGNVDNTADTAKPVSTAQQAAIDAAIAGAGLGSAFPKIAGNWYPSASAVVSPSAAFTANVIYMLPFEVGTAVTISDLGARVTTLSAGGKFQLAIYAAHAGTGLPTGSPVAYTGDMSTTSATTVSADITGANVTLAAGGYWGAICADNTTALYQTVSQTFGGPGSLVGSPTLGIVTSGSSGVSVSRLYAQTFGTWPDLTGVSTTEQGNARHALLYLKAA